MKTRPHPFVGRSAGFASALLTTALLLNTLAARADTSFTGTGYLHQVPVPGVFVTNGLGQVMLKGNVHVLAMQSSDPRVTGRFQAGMDVGYQADGTALFAGPAYFELGTWQNQTNFIPAAGLWVMNYRGVGQSDNSDQITITGYGVGGTIDGWRTEATATRAAGAVFDPAIPYLVSGTIKPAPVNTSVVLDNFNDGNLSPHWGSWSSQSVALSEVNGQLTVQGSWSYAIPHSSLMDHAAAIWTESWTLAEGRTMEWRVTLAGLNEHATAATLVMGINGQRLYGFYAGRSWALLGRWEVAGGFTVFSDEAALVRMSNVVLSFSLTRQQGKALLLARILDKDNQEAVLYQKSVTDLTPIFSGNISTIGVRQEGAGGQPPATATFDDHERRTYDVPRIGIQPAVQLTWPATGMNYAVEAAPTVQGPWLPFQDQVLPGVEQKTIPANDTMKFFRLQQAP